MLLGGLKAAAQGVIPRTGEVEPGRAPATGRQGRTCQSNAGTVSVGVGLDDHVSSYILSSAHVLVWGDTWCAPVTGRHCEGTKLAWRG